MFDTTCFIELRLLLWNVSHTEKSTAAKQKTVKKIKQEIRNTFCDLAADFETENRTLFSFMADEESWFPGLCVYIYIAL